MNCGNCKHWQGTKYSNYGDCYYLPWVIHPELDNTKLDKEDKHRYITGKLITPPFDPHDVKHIEPNSLFLVCYYSTPKTVGVKYERDGRLLYYRSLINKEGCPYWQERR